MQQPSARLVRFSCLSLTLALTGALSTACSGVHGLEPAEWSPVLTPIAPPLAGIAPRADLQTCLESGGELVEIGAVDNNDRHDHGALLTFGISRGGLLAAAGSDGTLKFWTLERELLATVDGSVLTYGSEFGAQPITDLAFASDDAAIASDVRGLVASMGADGSFAVLGGTTPDVPIVAVTYDEGGERIAHAQHGGDDVIPLVVRALGELPPEAPRVVEIAETLSDVADLGFAPDGALYVVGGDGGAAAIEVRDAADPTLVIARHLVHAAPYVELAASSRAELVAALAPGRIDVLRGGEIERTIELAEARPASLDVMPAGGVVFSAGASGALVAHRTSDGAELARVAIDDVVRVRVDPAGRRVVVGTRDALLHVLTCER